MSDASRHSRKKSASGPKPVSGPPPRGGLPLVPPDAGEQRIAYNGDLLSYQALPVVALGGSEGALHSLKEFFAHTPAATGCAYVVVLHAAPAHAVLLPGLIQAHTAMRVAAAADGEELRPDTVYVIPAARHLTVTGHRLRLSALPEGHTGRVAVDLFFRSLADSYGPHATAVVLSGADSDGTIGIKRIKERGGLTIAQDPGEAEFSAMPDSAITTGMVDWVLPARIMPARIRTYRERAAKVRLPPEEGPPSGESPGSAGGRPEAQLTEVLDFLRHRTGHDFSCYKRATILRRLSRRMQISGTESLKDYLHCLRAYPGEAGALAQDLLISVTNFFRDRGAFDLVESRIPELFRDKKPEDTVRIWCPACATGEEPYSMAMLLLEHARGLDAPPSLQVFGCDPNQEAIQTARAGLYPETVTADISRERLQAFFTREAGGYRVNREVREMVMFATHDLLRDAPFSRMDLISCRNLLIYLSREAQARALEIFNFALRPGGLLFLGSSESAEEGGGLFTPLDKTHRLYRQCPAQRAGLPLPTGLSEDTIQRMLSGHERLRGQPPAPPPPSARPVLSWPEGAATPAHSGGKRASDEGQEALDLHFRLLSRFGPPSVVVNADHDVLHLSENMHPFLRMPKGVPTRSLLRLIHPALRLRLRAGLMRAAETGEPAETGPLSLDLPGGPAAVRVRILPAGGGADPGCLLILFEVQESAAPGPAHASHAPEPVEPEEVVRQLEREVVRLHADLRSTVEQYESTTGELMASNEEFQAVNEELRSMGEELETSRAELQSINLKLSAVNAEFRLRAAELA